MFTLRLAKVMRPVSSLSNSLNACKIARLFITNQSIHYSLDPRKYPFFYQFNPLFIIITASIGSNNLGTIFAFLNNFCQLVLLGYRYPFRKP
jgi:hypothetical protein